MRYGAILAAAVLVLAAPVSGHHSDAALDMESIVTFEGTVTEFSMRNPHTYFTVETSGESGEQVEWTVQMASAISVSRMGWTTDSLSVGDRVMVGVHPARDGRSYGLFDSIERADGGPLRSSLVRDFNDLADPDAAATTLEGKWIVDSSSLVNYPGGLDQLMIAELTLTEKGKVAEAAYSQDSEENPELACITKPTPGMIVYTDLYPLEIEFNEGEETITLRSQYFDQERTVYMDGREHPHAGERFHEGHSIGRREGDVLVVDTANFADHRSPYQNGVPSGAGKHVVERYRLGEGGTRMEVEFMLEDPEYIVGSMTHSRRLIYSPQLVMTPFDCDLEATRRFVPQ
ncbi:MAG: DUF6152 family protein [Gammaproteobacteria bacterium]